MAWAVGRHDARPVGHEREGVGAGLCSVCRCRCGGGALSRLWRRLPADADLSLEERVASQEERLRRHRITTTVLYVFVIAACALAAAGAVRAHNAATDAHDAVTDASSLRRDWMVDQVQKTKVLCQRQREGLQTSRELRRISARSDVILLTLFKRLLAEPARVSPTASQVRARASVAAAAAELSEGIADLRAGSKRLKRLIYGDPKGKTAAARRGIDCSRPRG